MPEKGFFLDTSGIKNARSSVESAIFRPLDILKQKWENYNIDNSILFRPLNKMKDKIEPHTGATYQHLCEDELINAESALGRTIFGSVPSGRQREFFRDTHNVWLYYEKWSDASSVHEITVRYEVKPDGVYKKTGQEASVPISGAELENFRHALLKYYDLVRTNLYSDDTPKDTNADGIINQNDITPLN